MAYKGKGEVHLLFSTLVYKGKGDVLLGTVLFLTLAYEGKGEVHLLFSTLAYKGKGEVHLLYYIIHRNIFFNQLFYWVTSLKNLIREKECPFHCVQ